jgi:hypothetical protein
MNDSLPAAPSFLVCLLLTTLPTHSLTLSGSRSDHADQAVLIWPRLLTELRLKGDLAACSEAAISVYIRN